MNEREFRARDFLFSFSALMLDCRLKIISLAVERFLGDITTDALHYCKFHVQKDAKGAPRKVSISISASACTSPPLYIIYSYIIYIGWLQDGKLVLAMEDLALSLRDYGVNLTKPEYWADTPRAKETAKGKVNNLIIYIYFTECAFVIIFFYISYVYFK